MIRRKIVAGNWKMNMNLTEGNSLAEAVRNETLQIKPVKTSVVLCPPFIHLKSVAAILDGSPAMTGAQNCSHEKAGALTGEISAAMVKSTGAGWVIIGHSERRTIFGEDDKLLRKKTAAALEAGLKVIFCCGEVLPEREKNIHFNVVRTQIEEGLSGFTAKELSDIVIAYEPVWAIGTGVTASPQQAQEMHAYIRELTRELFGAGTAAEMIILYGGSCKASNAAELFAMPDVDGGLIGGASLNAIEFGNIIRAAEL